MTQVNRYGSVEISSWVTVGSLVELGGLLMTGIGLHRLLQNLESHFHLARQRQ